MEREEDDRVEDGTRTGGGEGVDRQGMRGATIPIGAGEKSGIEEAIAAEVEEGWQVPNREDGGPVDDANVINRVVLAKTAHSSLLFGSYLLNAEANILASARMQVSQESRSAWSSHQRLQL